MDANHTSSTADRLMADRGGDLRAKMLAALARSQETGRIDEFLVAQRNYNAEEARLRKELHELTGRWYEPRDD